MLIAIDIGNKVFDEVYDRHSDSGAFYEHALGEINLLEGEHCWAAEWECQLQGGNVY